MRAYNLFWHWDKPHLLCAVPEDQEVPRFIAKRAWSFDRKLAEAAVAPVGFDAMAARHGVRLNGFYLFQDFTLTSRCPSPYSPTNPAQTGSCTWGRGSA
jgi:hypothetical protein